MKILPVLKEKRRYILFEYMGNEEIIKDFYSFLKQFFGDFLFSKFSIDFLKINSHHFIIKVKRKYTNFILTSSLFFKSNKGLIIPIGVFPTIRKVKKYLEGKKNI